MEEKKILSLINRVVKKGDSQGFEELMRSQESAVFRLLYYLLPDKELVNDVSQEVWIKIYKNLDHFNGTSSFSTWVYRIAYNACMDTIRKNSKMVTYSMDQEEGGEEGTFKREYIAPGNTPEENSLQREEREEIWAGMEQLSQEHKTILTLRYVNELNYQEIEEITGLSNGTVKSRLARAKNSLKRIMEQQREQNINILRPNKRKEERMGGL